MANERENIFFLLYLRSSIKVNVEEINVVQCREANEVDILVSLVCLSVYACM